ncbi:calcium-binding protein [Planktothrix sp. FACHB-1365]|uniref:calcium-binding protein n=1 Tax=Planktothrix sp. FACHB-1365 TaxID=2692855 RepID=UPI0016877496|nr:hypothetical protein [Planktothrix sp. FACHB-1365]MBD2485254.1 hypothetical protein [Planktothrix sp. FACHB-1365]
MSVFFVNDNGAAIINIGGLNPPSLESVTQGIIVPPIIANPILEDVYFDSTTLIIPPLVTSSGELLQGTSGHDQLTGKEGNDTLQGLQGNDVLQGQDGNDFLFGGQGNDNLIGGEGNDVLSGDLGQDLLTGNSGNDIFILPVSAAVSHINTVDIITDFIVGEDRIGLTDGLSQTNIILTSTILSGSPGTLITVIQSNQLLGFIANVFPGGLTHQFIQVD